MGPKPRGSERESILSDIWDLGWQEKLLSLAAWYGMNTGTHRGPGEAGEAGRGQDGGYLPGP